jgi:hypothetical protein
LGVGYKADNLASVKKMVVVKYEEVKTGWSNSQDKSLAESSKEGCGSKGLFCQWR